jgi:hypothetical protein
MDRILATAYPEAHCELDFSTPLQLAVATILSAQSTDKRVNLTTPVLFDRYHTAADYAAADRDELEELIRPTGFYRNKTAALIGLGAALVERFGGELPGRPTSSRCLGSVVKPRTSSSAMPSAYPALRWTPTSDGWCAGGAGPNTRIR